MSAPTEAKTSPTPYDAHRVRFAAAALPVERGSLTRLLSLATAAAALTVAALPPLGWGGLAWIAIVPLLVALRGERELVRTALAGLVFGALVSACVASWIIPTLRGMGDVRLVYAGFALAAILAYQGFFYAVFGVLYVRLLARLGPIFAAVLAWTAAEALRLAAAPELAFLQLGHSQYQTLSVAQGAELFGVSGLSGLIVGCNAALAEAWLAVRAGDLPRAQRRCVAVGLFVAGVCLWGHWRLHSVERAAAGAATVRVAVAQVATPQNERWGSSEQRRRNLRRQLAVTQRALLAGAQLVVWPETAIEQRLDAAPELGGDVANTLAGDPARSLVAGAVRKDESGRFYNSVVAFDARGMMTGVYDKQRLFPVSEYGPAWIDRVPGARQAFAAMLRWEPFTPGADDRPLTAAGLDLGVLICFEGIDPGVARRRVAAGATVLLSAANDAILRGPGIEEQHFALTSFRAIELRRPLVRASNQGVGAIIDASGRAASRLEPDERGYLIADVTPRHGSTLYEAGGWALPWIVLAAAGLGCALPRGQAERPPVQPRSRATQYQPKRSRN